MTQNQISLLMADGSVRSFASATAASESTGVSVDAIRKCLASPGRTACRKGEKKPAILYAWKPSRGSNPCKPVAVFPAYGKDTLFFPSLKTAAEALGVSVPCLSKAIKDGSEIRRGGKLLGFADLALDTEDPARV